jgi:hypothetical protein
VVRYGPPMRRWADDLTLLGPADGSTAVPAPTRTLTPLTAVYLR